jgi:hypothetical protein
MARGTLDAHELKGEDEGAGSRLRPYAVARLPLPRAACVRAPLLHRRGQSVLPATRWKGLRDARRLSQASDRVELGAPMLGGGGGRISWLR